MRIILLVLFALLLAGCGGFTNGTSTIARLTVYIQNPTISRGSIVIEATKPSDPTFIKRTSYNLPAGPSEQRVMDFHKGYFYVVTMKHYELNDGSGIVLQTQSRDVDFTDQGALEMGFMFE